MSRSEDDNMAGAGADPKPADPKPRRWTPAFNLPGVVVAFAAILTAIHLLLTLTPLALYQYAVFDWFGFIPLRISHAADIPGGMLPLLWTPVTHAFLHGGWEHLLFNLAWLAVFGAPVARRYGAPGFIWVGVVGAVVGAFSFALFHLEVVTVMIGASGAVSGYTGAAMRFVFQPVITAIDPETGEPVVLGRRLVSPAGFLRNRRAMTFSIIWLILNAGFGIYALLTGDPSGVAWQAHIGGFVAGFVLIGWLERRALQSR